MSISASDRSLAVEKIHPNWAKTPSIVTKGHSIEITANDLDAFRQAAHLISAEIPVAVTFLPGDKLEAIAAVVAAVHQLGFQLMPHFSARRFKTKEDFLGFLHSVTEQGGVKRCFVVAGDPAQPDGPFFDTSALLAEGAFEAAGIQVIGLAGHPDGHSNMTDEECWSVLKNKCEDVEARGMAPMIVTQFTFDADRVLDWLKELRARGITAPVRIGVPGPAGIKRLLRFASRCGVGASASVMKKYGISLTRLMGTAGPDKLVDTLADGVRPEHGMVRLHFYPFGGLKKTVEWIQKYEASK